MLVFHPTNFFLNVIFTRESLVQDVLRWFVVDVDYNCGDSDSRRTREYSHLYTSSRARLRLRVARIVVSRGASRRPGEFVLERQSQTFESVLSVGRGLGDTSR